MKIKIFILSILSSFAISTQAATDTHKKDQEILGVLETINKNEIKAADEVKNKVKNTSVKDFANQMIKDHTQNLDETLAFTKTMGDVKENKDSLTLKMTGLKDMASLKMTREKNLDKTYIDAMVTDHESALKTIDENLIPNVTNADLKKHLETTREHVAHHLEMAKKIQASLTK